jgi:hypothetical protein
MQSYTSVPFKCDADSGFSKVNGIAKFSSAGIVLEFESKLLGLISKGVKEERLALGELLDIKFKKGVFKRGAKIEIRIRSMARLSELPNKDGKLKLEIRAEDFDRAQDAVAKLQKDLAAHAASLPPAHTPVSVLFDESEDETQELKSQ